MPQSSISGLNAEQQAQLDSMARWVNKMDSQWSIFGIHVGWDAVCGLVPVVGDVVTAAISIGLVNKARKMGAPKGLLLRMSGNVAVDFFGGALPVFGDMFDIAWRANSKNLALLERYYGIEVAGVDQRVKTARVSIVFVGLLISLAVIALTYYQQQL